MSTTTPSPRSTEPWRPWRPCDRTRKPGLGPYTGLVKRLSPVIILGAIAAFLLMRRREPEVVIPDSAWKPVEPS